MSTNAQPVDPTQTPSSWGISKAFLMVSCIGSTTALAGHVYQLITPAGGAIFGVTWGGAAALTVIASNPFFGDSSLEKIARMALVFFVSTLTALAMTFITGFSLTFFAGMQLSYLMIAGSMITMLALEIFNGILEKNAERPKA